MSLKTLTCLVFLLVAGVLFSLRGYLCAQNQAHAASPAYSVPAEPLDGPAAAPLVEDGMLPCSEAGCELADGVEDAPQTRRVPLALRKHDASGVPLSGCSAAGTSGSRGS